MQSSFYELETPGMVSPHQLSLDFSGDYCRSYAPCMLVCIGLDPRGNRDLASKGASQLSFCES